MEMDQHKCMQTVRQLEEAGWGQVKDTPEDQADDIGEDIGMI